MPVGPLGSELDVTLARFVSRVPGVRHAIAVGSDGLLNAMSPHIPRDRADAMSAITSGLVSLTTRSSRLLDGGNVAMTVVEMQGGHLFLMPSVGGNALVVWAEHNCDVGQVGYELAVLLTTLDGTRPPVPPALQR
jgi:predicted regulator of Ras-like GTPase activity (Roadblock/LC7/MglB family)